MSTNFGLNEVKQFETRIFARSSPLCSSNKVEVGLVMVTVLWIWGREEAEGIQEETDWICLRPRGLFYRLLAMLYLLTQVKEMRNLHSFWNGHFSNKVRVVRWAKIVRSGSYSDIEVWFSAHTRNLSNVQYEYSNISFMHNVYNINRPQSISNWNWTAKLT
jgi:hypothetical protein